MQACARSALLTDSPARHMMISSEGLNLVMHRLVCRIYARPELLLFSSICGLNEDETKCGLIEGPAFVVRIHRNGILPENTHLPV